MKICLDGFKAKNHEKSAIRYFFTSLIKFLLAFPTLTLYKITSVPVFSRDSVGSEDS